MGTKRPKFGAEGAVLENFCDILEKLRSKRKIGNKKRKIGYIWLFCGAAGTTKFFDPLSTRYFGIFSKILPPPPIKFLRGGGTAPHQPQNPGASPPTKISFFRPWVATRLLLVAMAFARIEFCFNEPRCMTVSVAKWLLSY